MVRIAVDAMGGDHAPEAIVDGAVRAAEQFDDVEILLVGPQDRITEVLAGRGDGRIGVIDAPEVVGMDESPVVALRSKPRSSIRVMVNALKEGECDAVFSAGSTGAVVAASSIRLGALEGVRRAGIAVCVPIGKKSVVLMDVGANIQCKPMHLFQYGLMASVFMSRVYDIESPRIGLLNVGEEEQKGTTLVKETKELFRASNLNYEGNIEGGDIFKGQCDVVVCDGFVGNIVLKVAEGLSENIIHFLRTEIAALDDKTGRTGPVHEALTSLATLVDYSEYGGASLLGVNGTVIIGHGRSDAKAVSSALRWARQVQRAQINEKIVEAVQETVV